MFTTLDKALAAMVMAVLFIGNSVFHWTIPGFLTETNIDQVMAVITPLLVYLVPNKQP